MSMVKDASQICCKEWAESQPAVINHTNSLPQHAFDEIIGTSAILRAVLKRVEIVGPGDSTVLILGETGTGKELIARAVHNCSRRSSRPFVTMNCAAIPQSLIAAELFGHEKGAFTGAVQRRLGRFEQAEEAPCSWMRSATFLPKPSLHCYVYCKSANLNAWVEIVRSTPT